MNKTQDWHCPLPFSHLEVQPTGDVFVCCHSLNSQKLGNLHEESLEEIWHGENVKKYQVAFMQGEGFKLPHCSSCLKCEQEGAISGRQRELLRWKDKLSNLKNELLSLAIRFSNLCNLKCRSCKPSTSTAWFTDAKKLDPNFKPIKVISAPKSNPISKQIKPFLDKGLEKIYFAGGEALLEEDHYKTLESVIESDSKVEISYDTNFSILGTGKYSALNFWNDLAQLLISASIDGSFKKCEFLRKGLSWQTFVDNWSEIERKIPHAKLKIHCTVSIYNIFHLPDLLKDLEVIDPNFSLDVGMCEDPIWLNIRCLPPEVKSNVKRVYKKFLDQSDNSKYHEPLEQILNYMQIQDDFKYFLLFKSFTKKMDELRNESFQEVFADDLKHFGRFME